MPAASLYFLFFFFNDTATTEIYTLSLHDALPILKSDAVDGRIGLCHTPSMPKRSSTDINQDRKSTRLNSSHQIISYAVFCLKKKNTSTLHSEDDAEFGFAAANEDRDRVVFYQHAL